MQDFASRTDYRESRMGICSSCGEYVREPHTHHGWGGAVRTAARNIACAVGVVLALALIYAMLVAAGASAGVTW